MDVKVNSPTGRLPWRARSAPSTVGRRLGPNNAGATIIRCNMPLIAQVGDGARQAWKHHFIFERT